jgi:15-cis-phytoene synthase
MSLDYCHDLVRSADKDRYLSSLFAPDEKRPQLLALYAFNIEIARIRETVSEAMLGEIRLKWWHDAIDGLFAAKSDGHPVVEALIPPVREAQLPKQAFINMIEARRFDLYDDPMPDLDALEGYLGETSSMLIQLAAMVLDRSRAERLADVSGLAGVALGMAGLLRSVPLHRARGQCFIPKDMLDRHGLTPAHFLAGRDPDALETVLAELRRHAAKRLDEARAGAQAITPETFPAYLPASLTGLYLARLEKLGPKSLNEVAEVAQWRRQWVLYRNARSRTL